MMSDVTLAHSHDQDLARHLPAIGTIQRAIRAKDGAPWQLVRLAQPLNLPGGACGWLLIRTRTTERDTDGTDVTIYDVVRGAQQIADGFDAAIFEQLGRIRTRPPHDLAPAPLPKPSWRKIGIGVAVVAFGGWLIWHFIDDPHVPMRPIVRMLVEILGHLK